MLFKSADFFFLSATLHTQKKVKERAYILTSYQTLLKAQLFFLLFVYLIKEKRKRYYDGNEFLFVSTFNFFSNTIIRY